MTNLQLAEAILHSCAGAGAREIMVCAGARNAPFVALLAKCEGFTVYSFFEERSASFFALGRAQAEGRPVVVVTTSGTAAAELLPAAIEADYQGLPLILLTADRPAHYRGSGAPQTINQIGIYSHYVEKSWDVEGGWSEEFLWSGRRPIHVNVAFDEPLLNGEVNPVKFVPGDFRASPATLAAAPLAEMREPLVLLSGILPGARAAVADVLRTWKRPIYAEATSGLRGQLGAYELLGGEKSLARLSYDGVIRVGRIPTVRLWRDLENKRHLPVTHFSDLPFAGVPRAPVVHALETLAAFKTDFTPWSDNAAAADRAQHARDSGLLDRFPLSEPAWVNWLSRNIPREARVFLGNSLPIREWDLAAARDRAHEIFANRGVNGIDGLISTFLGVSQAGRSNWAVIGDLSALYDLSGPWAARELETRDLSLVIINNGGGQIFRRMFRNPLFENRHDLNFSDWAAMWDWDYLRLDKPAAFAKASRPRVIEIIPSLAQTEDFYAAGETAP